MPSIDSAHPQKVDGMLRNRWTTYSGFGGRLAPESVVAFDRITHGLLNRIRDLNLKLVSVEKRKESLNRIALRIELRLENMDALGILSGERLVEKSLEPVFLAGDAFRQTRLGHHR